VGQVQEVTINVRAEPWSDAAGALLDRAMRCDPGATVATLRRAVARRQATLLCAYAAHELVGAVVLRIDRREGGAEGVIVAAAGRLAGVSLTRALLPTVESYFRGVKRIRVHTARRGLAKLLAGAGYSFREFVLHREVAC